MIKIDEKDKKNDMLEKSISPFMEFYDGTTTPFGKYGDDGEFHLYRNTTSRYGYMAQPIYGVAIKREQEEGEPVSYRYKIFIGEAPHKDENGNWITYNKVPSFYIGAFGGAHCLEEEPDIPHIIDICTDEWNHEKRARNDKNNKEQYAENYKLRQEIFYCSFRTYIKGLWNRMGRRFGTFSYYKGKHSTLYNYHLDKKGYHLQFVDRWEDKSLYLVKTYNGMLDFYYFRDNRKWGFRHERREDTGACCEA